VHLIIDGDLAVGRLQIRLISPTSGEQTARSAAERATDEAHRVAALPSESPELARVDRAAYTIDRTADVLELQGMTDFLVHLGEMYRAHGSQDASSGRGWRVAIAGVDPAGPPIGTIALREVALARVGGTTVVGPGTANAHRLAATPQAALPPRFARRTQSADGTVAQDAAFDRLLEGVSVPR
jgi:hypothetical protein